MIGLFLNAFGVAFITKASLGATPIASVPYTFWSLRQMFKHGKTIVEIVKMMNPINPNPDLQRMLLVGHGTLCILESGEAAIVHAGSPIEIALEMNLVAWIRFAGLGYREIVNIYARKERNIAKMDKEIQEEWERLLKA